MSSAERDIRNHELFKQTLRDSQVAVWAIAKWLSGRGNNVQVNCAAVAPSRSEWRDYSDHGDLCISQRVEVKHLSARFTGAGDWPFGDQYIVCSKHSFDNARPKPYAYFHVSCDMTAAGLVLASTFDSWFVRTRKDSRYEDVSQSFYFAPLDAVKFIDLTKPP